MLEDPDLVVRIYDALVAWTPAIQALVDGQGGTVAITGQMAAAAEGVLEDLRGLAAGDLAGVIDAETAALDPATWSGIAIGQLLDRVEGLTRPAPFILPRGTSPPVVR